MTSKEYKGKTGKWFEDKEAIVNVDIRNNKGDIISNGQKIIISGKSGRGGFNIMCNDIKYQKSGLSKY